MPCRLCLTALLFVAAAAEAQQPTLEQLRIIAPAAPGGGWDQTARVMQQVLQRSGRVHVVPVENIPGAAGTIGLARFVGAERGKGDALMVSGLIMLAAIVTHRSPLTLADVTPVARLTGEYEVIAVPAKSPFRTLGDFLEAFKRRPESISWSGGSAGGGDQIFAGLVAVAVGVPPSRVNYVAFSGGGESLSAIVGGQVSAGVSGLAEFAPHIAAGSIRALAISSSQRLPGLDVPTLREQGVDVEFENWRSLVAPPGIGEGDRQRLETLVAEMVRSPEWREALARYRWLDRYLPARPFAEFVSSEQARVERILRQFAHSAGTAATVTSAHTYPYLVLAGLVATAVLTLNQVRRSTVTSSTGAWAGWRPIGWLAAGLVLNLLLLERAGFVVAAALLFWCTARAFDQRRPWRDAAFAAALALAAYLLFRRGLQLPLPAGPLTPIL